MDAPLPVEAPSRVFEHRVCLPVAAATAFAWHERPGALARLTPPWTDIEVLAAPESLAPGTRAVLRVPVGPFRKRWVAEHIELVPGRRFRDVAVEGPFAHWDHTHDFLPGGPEGCELVDRIRYALPLGRLGAFVGGGMTRKQLAASFGYRGRIVQHDLWRHHGPGSALADGAARPLKILVSGASGFVGSALVPFLTAAGHDVVRLVRRAARAADEAQWDPETGLVDLELAEGADALIHLAGAGIADKRWNPARKQLLRGSRVDATRVLCESLGKLQLPPKAFVSASAIGLYGDRGDEPLDEDSPAGRGFLAELVRDWEAAAEPARAAGLRVAHMRLGVLLDAGGGALARMLLPFKLGAGGRLGSGAQFMSWVALDDALAALLHAVRTDTLEGAVNVVAPQPVSNAEFTRALGAALRRPTVLPMPSFAARLAFGELADELLLASQRVAPSRLQQSGFEFAWPTLSGALAHTLGSPVGDPEPQLPGLRAQTTT